MPLLHNAREDITNHRAHPALQLLVPTVPLKVPPALKFAISTIPGVPSMVAVPTQL